MIPDILFTSPESEADFERYYQFRWEQLRAPLDFPLGSERDEHESDAYHVCALKPDHEVIAVGRVHFTDEQHARIRFMAVADKYRRLGVGSLILSRLEHYAKCNQHTAIWLNARESILPFYLRNGYRVIEEVKTTLPIKHYRVEKSIDLDVNNQ